MSARLENNGNSTIQWQRRREKIESSNGRVKTKYCLVPAKDSKHGIRCFAEKSCNPSFWSKSITLLKNGCSFNWGKKEWVEINGKYYQVCKKSYQSRLNVHINFITQDFLENKINEFHEDKIRFRDILYNLMSLDPQQNNQFASATKDFLDFATTDPFLKSYHESAQRKTIKLLIKSLKHQIQFANQIEVERYHQASQDYQITVLALRACLLPFFEELSDIKYELKDQKNLLKNLTSVQFDKNSQLNFEAYDQALLILISHILKNQTVKDYLHHHRKDAELKNELKLLHIKINKRFFKNPKLVEQQVRQLAPFLNKILEKIAEENTTFQVID